MSDDTRSIIDADETRRRTRACPGSGKVVWLTGKPLPLAGVCPDCGRRCRFTTSPTHRRGKFYNRVPSHMMEG